MSSMKQIFHLILIFGLANAIKDDTKEEGDSIKIYKTRIPMSSNGIMGVASVAGFTSRNGRVSSMGGIHFFPPLDKPMSFSNSEIMKKINDNIEISYKKLYPEASNLVKTKKDSFPKPFPTIAIASTANVGLNQNPFIWPNLLDPMSWPVTGMEPTPDKINKNVENWLNNDIYNNFAPPANYLRNTWVYPAFNPFF